jgi:hypothetical protein
MNPIRPSPPDLWWVVLALAALNVSAADTPTFIGKHCTECHDAESKKGGLDLSERELQLDGQDNFAIWEKVHDAIANGDMPPKNKARPEADALRAVVEDLNDRLSTTDAARQQREGRTGARRLSRVEFENTLRDVLAVPALRVLADLPADGKLHGFDRSPAALDFSFVHLEKHLAAVDAALNAATPAFAEKPPVFTFRWHPWDTTVIGTLTEHKEAIGLIGLKRDETFFAKGSRITDEEPKATAIGLFRLGDESARYRASPYAPVLDGVHRIRLRGYSFGWDGSKVVPTQAHGAVSFAIRAKGLHLGTVDLPPNQASVVELAAWLERGGGMTPGVMDELMFTPETCERLPHYAGSKNGIRQDVIGPPFPAPGVAIEWIEIEGPIHETWPPPSQHALFGDLQVKEWKPESGVPKPAQQTWPRGRAAGSQPKDNTYGTLNEKRPVVQVLSADPQHDARRLLASFLRRAFRHPVTEEEIAHYAGVVASRLQAGDHFQDALKEAYRRALSSPDVMLLRGDDRGALASRLSYFLWAGPPDEELISLAARDELNDPEVRRTQASRLLRDEKAKRFIENFTDQWLRLREIDATQPDRQLYPEFTALLQESMVTETRAYFSELLDKDLGVAHFVRSDFAMLNQTLARHYGIDGVPGHELRRVTLDGGAVRGPFLAQASVHKITANGTTTSPVRRGAFVLEQLLGIVPKPPPPGVGSIEPDTRGATTVREQLAKHKTLATCASCHEKLDPYGFALERFDVTGAWRDHYRAGHSREDFSRIVDGRGVWYHFDKPVDASGELADGRAFPDYTGLRDLLAADERSMARAFVHHLITYATGAPVSFADRREVERILDHAEATHYGVRTLLLDVVASPIFSAP